MGVLLDTARVYIDDYHLTLTDLVDWFSSKQREEGCFLFSIFFFALLMLLLVLYIVCTLVHLHLF